MITIIFRACVLGAFFITSTSVLAVGKEAAGASTPDRMMHAAPCDPGYIAALERELAQTQEAEGANDGENVSARRISCSCRRRGRCRLNPAELRALLSVAGMAALLATVRLLGLDLKSVHDEL